MQLLPEEIHYAQYRKQEAEMRQWISHAKLGRMAAEALPPWIRDLLQKLPPSGEELSLLPECETLLDQLAASCLMMDWAYDLRFNLYGRQPSGLPIPHMLPDHDGRGAFFSGNAPSPGRFAQILTYLMEKTLCAWEKKEYNEFTRYGGIMGHFLQDVTAPTHTLSAPMRNALFPDPVPGRWKGTGDLCYLIDDAIPMEEVSCAGNDITQAVFSLTNQAFAAAERSRRVLQELLHGAYAADAARCRELNRGPARDAASLTAEAWCTVLSIAFDRCPQKKKEVSLTQLRPLFHHPDLYAYAPAGIYCMEGKTVPITLLSSNGIIPCKNAFAMKGHSGMKFFLNKAFDTLEFTLGLSPFPESTDPRMSLEFTVETAPEWNTVASEDMLYGAKEVLKIPLKAGTEVRRYKADIRGADTLILACKAAPYRTEEGSVDFIIPHLGIDEGLLC